MQFSLTDSQRLPERLFLIAPFFLWGTAMVAMKGVLAHTTPLFMGGLRIAPAGLLVIFAAALLGKKQPQGWRAWLWIVLFSLIDVTCFQGFLALGLSHTSAGLGSVMIDSQPLAVALLALFLYGERIGVWGWLGLGIGITGISCIGLPDEWILQLGTGEWLQQGHAILQWQSWLQISHSGEFLMLLAALSMAVGTVMIRQVCRYADPISATGWHMFLGGLPLFFGSGLWESEQWGHLTSSDWIAISYAAIFGSAIAYGLFFYFASKGNLTSLSSLTFLTPVFALVFGNLFLSEVLSPIQTFGVGLTLVSIYFVNQREQLPQPGELLAWVDTRLVGTKKSKVAEIPIQVDAKGSRK
ncbi:DMT family transporter [Acaryochloris sp. IP29b_bin.137]|uniref:DMT family transporter n=1 Tax=Acaryochloris sp. IP29b_bin.137 TaxID=2969217 RepID=UPI002619E097|nr:DMT family transporter [Acaryochloris sp. IP29b_bin.137]